MSKVIGSGMEVFLSQRASLCVILKETSWDADGEKRAIGGTDKTRGSLLSFNTLAHGDKPQAFAPGPELVESLPIILNIQADQLRIEFLPQGHFYPAGVAMAGNIGKSLLDDAQQAFFQLWQQRGGTLRGKLYHNSCMLRPVLEIVLKCSN